MRPLRFRKIGHLLHVPAPDHPAEPGIIGVIDEDHAATFVPPQDGFILRVTERTGIHGFINIIIRR
jgi:hypothetical protein